MAVPDIDTALSLLSASAEAQKKALEREHDTLVLLMEVSSALLVVLHWIPADDQGALVDRKLADRVLDRVSELGIPILRS